MEIDLFGNKVVTTEESEEKIKKVGLFDMLNDITNNKVHLVRNGSVSSAEILPFMILSGLSQGVDTVMYANDMNINYNIPVDIQYDYLFHSIRKRKRYNKWAKKLVNKDIDNIIEYFNYSYDKALQAEKVLTKEQLKMISDKLSKGGMKK